MIETDLPDQFLYSRQGPWPQPSPSHPMICADEVLHIPEMEELMFNQTIGLRYLKSKVGYPPQAALYATSVGAWTGVTHERFDQIMLTTLYTRFKTHVHDSEMDMLRKEFAGDPGILEELNSGTWYKYDFTAMDLVKPIDGTYSRGSKVFIRQDADRVAPTPERAELEHRADDPDDFVPPPLGMSCRIITVGEQAVHCTDSSWGIASCYALQGASYHVLFVVHPAIHFPMDSVNAITKTSVPMGHPLFQLFLPHSTYSLPLDNAVLESSMSVVNNNAQGTRFDPLTADGYNLKLLFGAGYNGMNAAENGDTYLPGAYPQYDYMKPAMYTGEGCLFDSFYGKWLRAYYDAFLEFCKPVAEHIKADPKLLTYTKNWARYCATHVHGFPGPHKIVEGDTLAEVMAIYCWNNSVSHGGDHWSFANQVSPVEKCLRIRRKPPASRNEAPVNNADTQGGQIFSPNDMQRAALCQYMFFQAWAIEPNLAQTYYAFTDQTLQDAMGKLHLDMEAVNKKFCRVLKEPLTLGADSDAKTTCMPLKPIPHPDDTDGHKALHGDYLVPYARTLPQSIQY